MSKICFVCGSIGEPSSRSYPITQDLIETWGIDSFYIKFFNKREGVYCSKCENSNRTITLAKAIADHYKVDSFASFIKLANNRKMKIAEINGAGKLHGQLKQIKHLYYSEYNLSRKKNDPPHEDIANLSYNDEFFDLVIHSETLEHIPYPEEAVKEIKRVLKPDGVCLFTIPITITKRTKLRFTKKNGNRILNKKKSYHGYGREDCVVWWEYGYDLQKYLGSDVVLCYSNPLRGEYVFGISKKQDVLDQKSIAYARLVENFRRVFGL